MKMEVMCQRAVWRHDIEMVFFTRHENGKTSVGKSITMETIDDGEITQPTVTLRNDMAQELMDGLWRCGLRPTEGAGSAGSLAATERHLKDMQKIALGLLQEHGVK